MEDGEEVTLGGGWGGGKDGEKLSPHRKGLTAHSNCRVSGVAGERVVGERCGG